MNFLLFRTDSIGDLVLSLSVPQGLKRKFNGSSIIFVCNPLYKHILLNHPDIDVITYFENLNNIIKEIKIDVSLHLFPRFKEALFCFIKRIPERIGTFYRPYSFLFNKKVFLHRKKCEFHESFYNVLLLKKAGYDIDYSEPKLYLKDEEREKIKEKFKNYRKPFIIIHPESRGSAPNWSFEKYNKLLKILKIDGTIFITGSEKNFEFFKSENIIDLRGTSNLRDFINFISICDLVFAPSTGVIHIASALNIKIVSIFSEKIPFTPKRWGPLGKGIVLTTPSLNIEEIPEEEVKDAIISLLEKNCN